MEIARLKRNHAVRGTLDGQMLLAMPSMPDARFARSVIYMCAHSSEGAMGFIVNQKAPDLKMRDLLVQLEVVQPDQAIRLPPRLSSSHVLRGGPVETSRGFVLHSADFFAENATINVDDGLCLTATLDVLRALAHGHGPRRAVLALGYAMWSPGQLEREMQGNNWLHCPGDHGLVFDRDLDSKYSRALETIGVDLRMLSSETGRA
jgi:putative transcriptional regulator